jgi:hypothetical protein
MKRRGLEVKREMDLWFYLYKLLAGIAFLVLEFLVNLVKYYFMRSRNIEYEFII